MKAQDKKKMKEVYELVKELTPIVHIMRDLADERMKIIEMLDRIKPYVEEVEDILGSEQEIYDNRSDKWKESDKGQMAAEHLSYLDDIHSHLSDCIYYLEELQ